jgi:hypothetical protein
LLPRSAASKFSPGIIHSGDYKKEMIGFLTKKRKSRGHETIPDIGSITCHWNLLDFRLCADVPAKTQMRIIRLISKYGSISIQARRSYFK